MSREISDLGTLTQHPLVVHNPLFYPMSLGDSNGFGRFVMFLSSPIHYILALNLQDLLQVQWSVFSFSMFNSICFI